ncbi:MarR family EPS-associated transcriptional regulator [Methylotenera mobilis]|uniref:Putative transcriptional regulator n=1 Tax=Methylotenera mobilis (strain JLW8 / ATCC BAA-1282 / DSM 17540) TaxID=583345 RepID=C6WVI3_METML|nr:MarR family EPS-associated transcriptional regulator [Methylotenera mobilis]ACT47932.1 putative transcriptional regulator [Methylotenera mobilis JLW8]
MNGLLLINMLTDEYKYKILKLVAANSETSQRELSKALGISLGKTNYCLQALIEKGMLKVSNFKNSKNKLAYMYLLTPKGIEEKSAITLAFLKAKIKEYEMLDAEIKSLSQEVNADIMPLALNLNIVDNAK